MSIWRVQYGCGHWTEIPLPSAEQAAGAQAVADDVICPECAETLKQGAGHHATKVAAAAPRAPFTKEKKDA